MTNKAMNPSNILEAKRNLQNIKLIPRIKNIVAVGSGKGGVGKSTMATGLALALKEMGLSVGLLDCDIYGPSIPQMMGLAHIKQPDINADQHMIAPKTEQGIPVMSIGFLVEPEKAIIWRGPMVSQAVDQLIKQTDWGAELDVLVIDLPPGTGDIHLSLFQKIPITGVIIVSTPQEVALADARRACEMLKKLNVRLLGVVENMSHHVCSQCGHKEHLFGEGGGARLAQANNTVLLGQFPLQIELMQRLDRGQSQDAFDSSDVYDQMMAYAQRVFEALAKLPKNYDGALADIGVVKA
jgi:ATP-binding protein involved in chromosome partitioning